MDHAGPPQAPARRRRPPAAVRRLNARRAGVGDLHRVGRRLFKPDARILRTDRLDTAEAFFHRHGPLALVLGRFVPIVRTYVPLAAGTAGMPYRRFLVWNVTGAVGWVVSMTAVGALLGRIPGIAHSIDAIVLVIVGISVLPMVVSGLRKWWLTHKAAPVT